MLQSRFRRLQIVGGQAVTAWNVLRRHIGWCGRDIRPRRGTAQNASEHDERLCCVNMRPCIPAAKQGFGHHSFVVSRLRARRGPPRPQFTLTSDQLLTASSASRAAAYRNSRIVTFYRATASDRGWNYSPDGDPPLRLRLPQISNNEPSHLFDERFERLLRKIIGIVQNRRMGQRLDRRHAHERRQA